MPTEGWPSNKAWTRATACKKIGRCGKEHDQRTAGGVGGACGEKLSQTVGMANGRAIAVVHSRLQAKANIYYKKENKRNVYSKVHS